MISPYTALPSAGLIEWLLPTFRVLDVLALVPGVMWCEMAVSLAAVVAWKLTLAWVARQIAEAFRPWLADRLFHLAEAVAPAI
jgi:hypothetical protein